MNDMRAKAPIDWVRVLAAYRDPDTKRSAFELAVTLLPFLAIFALAWWVLPHSGLAALALAVLNAGFLVRLFVIQHDCGHGSYFKSRSLSDWTGRLLGVLTFTPYDVWRRTHAIHHASHGNLDQRGIGDIVTLTVAEYRALSPFGKLRYRAYRHPITLFLIGPIYIFVLQNRLPVGLMRAGSQYWTSAMGTNIALAALFGALFWFGGWKLIAFVAAPTVLLAAAAGMWLFFVQHQFEEAHWDKAEDWQIHDAALNGSSHYILPPVLRWFSGNIGIHHVHHLYSRIPFYRLPEVIRDHAALAEAQRLTLAESLGCIRLHLWDETSRRLMSFAEARRLAAA
ncbi:MAG: fatty acid desaturase [Rhodobacteraceae bacterium]|nr:fatty acid desaturase [Paracoccaceae bacterium]